MNELDLCLRQVQKIRDVASGKALPYVARSRIGRLALGLDALVAAEPKKLGVKVAALGKNIQAIAKSICQPSEPLDARWRAGWADLIGELTKLEKILVSQAIPSKSLLKNHLQKNSSSRTSTRGI
jgi:hypothetical protein